MPVQTSGQTPTPTGARSPSDSWKRMETQRTRATVHSKGNTLRRACWGALPPPRWTTPFPVSLQEEAEGESPIQILSVSSHLFCVILVSPGEYITLLAEAMVIQVHPEGNVMVASLVWNSVPWFCVTGTSSARTADFRGFCLSQHDLTTQLLQRSVRQDTSRPRRQKVNVKISLCQRSLSQPLWLQRVTGLGQFWRRGVSRVGGLPPLITHSSGPKSG